MKLQRIRWIVLGAIFLIIVIGLISSISMGTLSSFGWEAIATICPLGVLESFLAGKTVFFRALAVLAIVFVVVVILGKVFCAWICPVAPIRSFTEIMRERFGKSKTRAAQAEDVQAKTGQAEANLAESTEVKAAQAETVLTTAASSEETQQSTAGCSADCSSCATKRAQIAKRAKVDSRHVVLGGALLSAAIFGFPVFCLICPIGLIFATVVVLWQWLGLNTISWSLLLYPALLILELLVLRKWCMKFCPVGALLSLMSLPNRFFRPKVDSSKCLREKGVNCNVCVDVCPEGLDPHFKDGMNECTKCGLCKDKCPVGAITIPFKAPSEPTIVPLPDDLKQS